MLWLFLQISLAFASASKTQHLVERISEHEVDRAKYNPFGKKDDGYGDIFDTEEIMEELARNEDIGIMNDKADNWKCGLEDGWENRNGDFISEITE